eukprot:scaffold190758_cov28-Prasinocladus_malaysianus.AAC.1
MASVAWLRLLWPQTACPLPLPVERPVSPLAARLLALIWWLGAQPGAETLQAAGQVCCPLNLGLFLALAETPVAAVWLAPRPLPAPAWARAGGRCLEAALWALGRVSSVRVWAPLLAWAFRPQASQAS